MPTYTRAVFSDVHANLDALKAVLEDMAAREVRTCVCLGDIVGYAAEPAECLETVRKLRCPILMGNHDEAAASEIHLFDMRGAAQSGIQYARERLTKEQRAYLAELPLTRTEPTCEFVHASLDDPGEWSYIFSAWEALQHFERQTQRLCFCGHTHVPMMWRLAEDGSLSSTRGVGRMALPADGKILVNVGSVGQPRDDHPEACYVLYHTLTHEIEFRRVPYDISEARRKILKADLPSESGNRLFIGR